MLESSYSNRFSTNGNVLSIRCKCLVQLLIYLSVFLYIFLSADPCFSPNNRMPFLHLPFTYQPSPNQSHKRYVILLVQARYECAQKHTHRHTRTHTHTNTQTRVGWISSLFTTAEQSPVCSIRIDKWLAFNSTQHGHVHKRPLCKSFWVPEDHMDQNNNTCPLICTDTA